MASGGRCFEPGLETWRFQGAKQFYSFQTVVKYLHHLLVDLIDTWKYVANTGEAYP